jgi:hypothetical protein
MFTAAPIDSENVVLTGSFIDLVIDRMLCGYGLVSDLPNDLKSTINVTFSRNLV